MTSYAIGIDLGTTYSCVGVVKDGQVRIIHNDYGSTTTASCVAFTDFERIIGDPAKAQGSKNFQNTVFDVKRLIGRKFSEAHIQNDIKHWPFTVVNQNGTCGVQVQFKKQTETFSPEELSAMILTKMKKSAEDFLRQEVTRQATKDAAAIAGLNVLRIINEPTAAGIAYALDEKATNEQNILVYDLGGGTFDVTVMTVHKKNWWLFRGCHLSICVRSTSGDTHLGGEDFDSCLVDYCLSDIKKRYNTDISSNKRALRKLRTACEAAKRLLSGESQTTIEVDGLINGVDYSLDICRSRFEELCFHLFEKTLVFVEKALVDANIAKEKIDEIILVGGSTRIPGVRCFLQEYFQEKKLNNTVHPDEAVAYGAAIQAAILAKNQTALLQDVRIQDVTPMTLGLDTLTGKFQRIIAKNTCLPARQTGVQITAEDNQEGSVFIVYEGENDRALKNDFLGKFKLLGTRKAPEGEVVFNVDENSILDVHATERGTKNTGNIRITRNTGRLSKDEIDRMIKNEAKFVADDMALKLR